ncbi:histidine kinase N-terminal 7TM domain-containing protein [Paenibacillus sp. WC2504]|uniref:histidine kinase N-terminal 7TM domain-containing protein n=1 Tax=Paenibacillus sp. WC2504 TaxID=3461403 RepID=UPI0040457149
MSYNLYLSVLLMAATCSSLVIVYICWQRREFPIAISYGLGMLTGVFYTFGYAFEIVSSSLEQIKFWLRIEYIGIPFGTIMWFVLVLQYTGRQRFINKWYLSLLLIVPMITFVSHNTNEWHHLFYKSMTLDYSEGYPLVILEKGPFYKLHVFYSYSFLVIGTVLLFHKLIKATPRMRKQVGFMIIGSWGIFGFTLVYLSGILNIPIDISPFGFIFSGVFYLWGIYQFNMLRLAPLALQKVFGSMQDAVMVFDLDDTLTSFNQSAKRVISGIHHDWIGQSASQVFANYPKLLESMMKGPSLNGSIQLSGQSDVQYYQIYLSDIHDNRQRPAGRMLLLSNVTERVRSEEQLRDNARQLSELNSFKDKMFNVVAHDIRDPLAVLINLVEIMEDDFADVEGEHEEIVREMSQQIQSTFILVEGLLDWFLSQRGGMTFNPVKRDLAQMVQANISHLQIRSEYKHIQIMTDIPKDSFVYADKEMLDLIIRNLLSNAIKFTNSGGHILIHAATDKDQMIVSVSDTGAGMSSDQVVMLQQASPISSLGTAGERGVGLGLTLCREFVQLNGGDLWFESSFGQGSTFYFSLPTQPRFSARLVGSMGESVR